MTHLSPSPNGKQTITKFFPELDLTALTSAKMEDLALQVALLLSKKERKDTASFYTAPWAASLLSGLVVTGSEFSICDPACGSGNLLLSVMKRILQKGKTSETFQIFGSEINPVAGEVARIVLESCAQSFQKTPEEAVIQILEGDAFHITAKHNSERYDLVIMNPPFSSQMRLAQEQKSALRTWAEMHGLKDYVDPHMGLHFYFLFLANGYLREGGVLALIIPVTTFAGKAGHKILQFMQHQGYSFELVVEFTSPKGAFSVDCCWKEYLVVARKGKKDVHVLRQTRLVKLVREPTMEDIPSLVRAIRSGDEDIRIGNVQFAMTRSIREERVFAGTLMSEFLPFFGGPPNFLELLTTNQNLVPISKSDEIGTFRGFDATYSRYLVLPNEFLDNPKISPSCDSIHFDVRNISSRAPNEAGLTIPLKYLRPCIKDPRAHDVIFQDSNQYWLLLIPLGIINPAIETIAENYLRPLTEHIELSMHQKARNGGKEILTPRTDWFTHPWSYFSGQHNDGMQKPADLTGHVWTFNRYGLWRRNTIATFSTIPVTGNHGCHSYFLKNPSLVHLQDKCWKLLTAWFNSTLYLVNFFAHAKTPAKHVQQVNLLEHRQMLIPKMARILEKDAECTEIIENLHILDEWLKKYPTETLPQQMHECQRNHAHPRATLDASWIKILNVQDQCADIYSIYKMLDDLLDSY